MSEADWPNNGVEFNRWYHGLPLFLRVMSLFDWPKASRFKYVNLRIDTKEHELPGTHTAAARSAASHAATGSG
jgi:hypothetical protein